MPIIVNIEAYSFFIVYWMVVMFRWLVLGFFLVLAFDVALVSLVLSSL